MTLVVAFPTPSGPALMGDLLLSAPAPDDAQSVRVPTVGEVGRFVTHRPGWAIHGLAQKVVVIDDSCAVAWAGDMETAGAGIAAVRKLPRPLTVEGIKAFWTQHNEGRPLDQRASLVGAVVVAPGQAALFGTDGAPFRGKNLGTICANGSGVEALNELDTLLGSIRTSSNTVAGSARDAVARTLVLAGILLTNEVQGEQEAGTLKLLFGGSYEFCFYAEKRFQKLDNFSFVIWTATVVDDKVYSLGPKLVLKQQYIGDWLVVQSVRLELRNNGLAEGSLRMLQRHVVPPVYPSGPEPAELLSFESHVVCHSFAVHAAQRGTAWFNRVAMDAPTTPPAFAQEFRGNLIGLRPRPGLIDEAKGWLDAQLESARNVPR